MVEGLSKKAMLLSVAPFLLTCDMPFICSIYKILAIHGSVTVVESLLYSGFQNLDLNQLYMQGFICLFGLYSTGHRIRLPLDELVAYNRALPFELFRSGLTLGKSV
jgi:hypothetical protein